MPAIVFALAIAAVIAAATVTPTNMVAEQTRFREALGQWTLALQDYRAAHCETSITEVSEASLISEGYLAAPLHPEIEFSARITAAGRAQSNAVARSGQQASVLTKAWVATNGSIESVDGVDTLIFHTNEYSQGGSPPGALLLVRYHDRTTECKQ